MKSPFHNLRRLVVPLLIVTVLATDALALSLPAASLVPGEVREVIPIGAATGIKLKSDGVIVVGISDVSDAKSSDTPSPARSAGLKKGDIIVSINGEAVTTGDALIRAVEKSGGKTMQFAVKRGDADLTIAITPVKTKDSGYKVGILVRDSLMGIGTITFYEPKSGVYGALGHGISDPDSGCLVPIADGTLIPSTVSDVTKGESGNPGELHGAFDTDKASGTVEKNDLTGIYGHLGMASLYQGIEPMPIAHRNEIVPGAAKILSTVAPGETKEYDIRILKVAAADTPEHKDMLIQVTDPELLAITGGIVQGMSGSPIVQNGKLIGAVTHVLVSDPTRGYGICIEEMLEAAA